MNFSIGNSDKKHAVKFWRVLGLLIVFNFLILPLSAQKKRGKVTTKYPSGQVESSGKVKNYKKQGVWKYWSESGVLMKSITLKDNALNGLYTEYYGNGKKSLEGNYANSVKEGIWYSWYSDGKVSGKQNYRSAGCATESCYDGIQQYWYESGTLREQTYYENKQLVYREKWYANGKRRVIEHYKDGQKNGTWRKYPEPSESTDTLPSAVDNYVDGKRDGVHLAYVRGRLSEEFYYKNGELHGTYKIWDTNSQLGVSENYVDGKRDGLCRYFNYGKCIREVTYENGRINGEEKEYDGRGELFRISWYKKGTIDSSYNYHKNGRLAISRTYKYYPGFVKTEEFSEYTEWDTAGVLLLRGTYHFEKKDKGWTTYYTNGKVKSVTPYNSGKIKGIYTKWHANGKKMIEMECDGYYVVSSPKVWDEKGKMLKEGTKAYHEIVDSSMPGEIYNDPKKYRSNRTIEGPPSLGDYPVMVGDYMQDSDGIDVVEEIPVVYKEIESKEDVVFTFVEQMPEFPSENGGMKQFIQDNIKYPTFAKEAGIQGTVWVTYIIEKDGSVTNVKEVKSIPGAPELTKEAIRVVASFPKHEPGLMNGRPVRVQQTTPVKFVLK
jgi:TonB family protein